MERERDSKGRFTKGNKEGHRFKKGEVTNPTGRPPLMCNALKNLPQDAKDKVHDALWTAISQPDVKSAQAYLQKAAEELPNADSFFNLQ